MNPPTRTPAALVAGFLASLVLASLMLGTSPSGAVADPTTAPPTFSLAISPTRLVIGQDDTAETQEIKVINGGTAPMQVDVDVQDFTTDRDGSLVFQESAPYSASTWITVTPSSFEVPAGETQVVTADFVVPAQPEPGDHQLALVFLVPAGKTAANVRINRGIGMPVFVTVPGPTDDSVDLTGLEADGFVTGGPVEVTATVENTGTVHRDFRADTPLLVTAPGDADPFPDFTVMRGSTREITTSWDPPFLCICHPTVSVANADGTTSSTSVRVIVFPWPLALIVLLGLLALIGLYRLARRRYRSSVARAAAALRPVVGAAHAPS